jgi:hypothetical protein
VLSWTESSWYSYYSTQTITYITTIPCSIFTTYTTLTTQNCPEHCTTGIPQTICSPKSCAANGMVVEEAYSAGDLAPALVTGPAYAYPITIFADQCTSTAAFVDNSNPAGLPACSTTVDLVCIASPCLVYSSYKVTRYTGSVDMVTVVTVTFTSTADYSPGQDAFVSGTPPYTTPAISCLYFTSPTDGNFGISPTAQCPTSAGGGDGAVGGSTDTCGGSVVTYSYTTSGAEIVETTTLPGRCILFSARGNKMETTSFNLLVWLWYVAAILSGIGMIAL